MTPALRRWVFFVGIAGLVAFYLWGLKGLPGFGGYPGPYGAVITHIAVGQTNATGVVSAVNFDYRGFDTVGEEFILLIAAIGVSTVLRHLRAQHDPAKERDQITTGVRATSDAVRLAALVLVGPMAILGWLLVTHAQTNPSGGFQGGVVLATAVIMIYLAGEFLVFERVSPVDIIDSAEAIGAGGFAVVGVAAVAMGLAYLTNFLPLGGKPGAVSSSGTIVLISFFVGVEVTAAFISIVGELLEQTLVTTREGR
jgi:multicomponent Na+:H+ antiporter subunit B